MKKVILSFLFVLYGFSAWSAVSLMNAAEKFAIAPSDTTSLGEDLDEDEDSVPRTRKNVAEGYNAMKYVMEGRYVPEGDTFVKKPRWLRNFYIQGGFGFEKITPPDNIWEISPMISGQLGIGKDFSKLHSARLMFHAATGYLLFRTQIARSGMEHQAC